MYIIHTSSPLQVFFFPCAFCWCITAFLVALLPHIEHWNSAIMGLIVSCHSHPYASASAWLCECKEQIKWGGPTCKIFFLEFHLWSITEYFRNMLISQHLKVSLGIHVFFKTLCFDSHFGKWKSCASFYTRFVS